MSPIVVTNSGPSGRIRRVAPALFQSVVASIARYDGNSGSAVFRGAIPFAPGVITSESDLDNVRLLVNGSEPAGGIYIQLLNGRHSDDSYRSTYVEFTATCGTAETVACEVRINQTRNVADIGSPADAVELSPRSWQAAPTLFAITDAAYLCASKVAPLPLVPLTHPNLPSSVVTYLTTEMDRWNTATTQGTAGYDEHYVLICRYLTTGNAAFLAEALERAQSESSTRTQIRWDYYLADSAVSWQGVDFNPSNYTKTTGGTAGSPAEWQDHSLTHFMMYQLTGWEYGRLHIERNATSEVTHGFGDQAESVQGSYTQDDNHAYPRQVFRWRLQQGVLGAMLRMNRYVKVGTDTFDPVFKSPTDAHGTAAVAMSTRVQNRITRLKALAEARVAGVDVPSWWPTIWGVTAASVNGTTPFSSTSKVPNFQFTTAASLWMANFNGIDTRSDLLTQLDAIADWVISQTFAPANGRYVMPYQIVDPANPGTYTGDCNTVTVPTSGVYPAVLAWLYAWKYARTGNTTARDLYDAVCNRTHLYYCSQTDTDERLTRKQMGELFYLAYHGAALRAGVNPLTGN